MATVAQEGERSIETLTNQITMRNLIPGRFYEFKAYSIGVADALNPIPSSVILIQTGEIGADVN